jgi:hypothetical protein
MVHEDLTSLYATKKWQENPSARPTPSPLPDPGGGWLCGFVRSRLFGCLLSAGMSNVGGIERFSSHSTPPFYSSCMHDVNEVGPLPALPVAWQHCWARGPLPPSTWFGRAKSRAAVVRLSCAATSLDYVKGLAHCALHTTNNNWVSTDSPRTLLPLVARRDKVGPLPAGPVAAIVAGGAPPRCTGSRRAGTARSRTP